MRPLERVEYPAQRELVYDTPTTDTPAPNFCSLDLDNREWVKQGVNFMMYKNERIYHASQKPASATDFYNTDQSSKMSLSHRVQRSPHRYVTMRSQSVGREGDRAYLGMFVGTPERVGPGSYVVGMGTYVPTAGGKAIYRELHMPRCEPMSSPFASGLPRNGGAQGFGVLRNRTAEPGYSTLDTDQSTWKKHENQQTKGFSFNKTHRWVRSPGPGSNQPSEKDTPGPGAYGRIHVWPKNGFKGSSHGYNHNVAIG